MPSTKLNRPHPIKMHRQGLFLTTRYLDFESSQKAEPIRSRTKSSKSDEKNRRACFAVPVARLTEAYNAGFCIPYDANREFGGAQCRRKSRRCQGPKRSQRVRCDSCAEIEIHGRNSGVWIFIPNQGQHCRIQIVIRFSRLYALAICSQNEEGDCGWPVYLRFLFLSPERTNRFALFGPNRPIGLNFLPFWAL